MSAVKQVEGTTAKPWDARFIHPVPHTVDYYLKCIGGGVISCGLTHTLICPLDVVKCNMQVNPTKFKSLSGGLKIVAAESGYGTKGIWKGWLPTLYGYSAQGAFKFSLYEVFKDLYMNLAGQQFSEQWCGAIWLAASASAEFFADIALCPLEMVKVKMQTSASGEVSHQLLPAIGYMRANNTGFPFKSLTPLWSRQIPYTMAKFYFFERIVRLFYAYVLTEPKESYTRATQLSVTFASGYLAGIVCAIVSHPADTLVSLRGKPSHAGKSYGQIAAEFGYANLFVKGLPTRILMIGTLTGLQWWIYDSYKSFMGLNYAAKK